MHTNHLLWKYGRRITVWTVGMAFCLLSACASATTSPTDSINTVLLDDISELEKTLATPMPQVFTSVAENDALTLTKALTPKQQGFTSWQAMLPALQRSQQYVATRTAGQVALAHGYFTVTWGELAATLTRFIEILPQLDDKPELLAQHFVWARLDKEPLFSGYYEPIIDASLTRQGAYQYPLYRRPKDLQVLHLTQFNSRFIGQSIVYRLENNKPVPYYDREAIDKHAALKGQNLELAWVKDQLDAFTLQLQGSGLLRLQDGRIMPIAYAARNGHAYMSIGQYLSDQGHIPPELISMPRIRQWMKDNPKDAEAILNRNRSYVFFQPSDRKEQSPVGAMGKALTPYVSLAVDRTLFPFGSVMAFTTNMPVANGTSTDPQLTGKETLFGLGLAQDSGTAMIGSRIDIFCGTGDKAGLVAGSLRAQGEVWLLLLKEE